jgi:hypothetical protein
MSEQSKEPNRWYFSPDFGVSIFPMLLLLGTYFVFMTSQLVRTGDIAIPVVAILSAGIGVVLLFFARLPLYRQRRFFAFGSKLLDEPHRRFYRWAYRFICLGVLLLLLTLLALG